MTEDEIRAAEARLDEATPGDWNWTQSYEDNPATVYAPQDDLYTDVIAVEMSDADADFIAHAPTDVRKLISLVRELQDGIAAEREACAKLVEGLVSYEPTGHFDERWATIQECAAAIRARGELKA